MSDRQSFMGIGSLRRRVGVHLEKLSCKFASRKTGFRVESGFNFRVREMSSSCRGFRGFGGATVEPGMCLHSCTAVQSSELVGVC